MPVHQLSSQNFQVVGRNTKSLNINIPGNVLVFFKMDGCHGCSAFEPVFYQLAGEERRASCAIANLSQCRDVIAMSRSTTTPIQAVPYIVLYVSGNPIAKYTGKKTIPSLQNFLNQALPPPSQTQTQDFMQQPSQPHGPPSQGMYGSGGYSHPQMAPHQGHSGYNPPHGPPGDQAKIWAPEIDKGPSLQGIVKGDGGG